jgi:hypothetical protein
VRRLPSLLQGGAVPRRVLVWVSRSPWRPGALAICPSGRCAPRRNRCGSSTRSSSARGGSASPGTTGTRPASTVGSCFAPTGPSEPKKMKPQGNLFRWFLSKPPSVAPSGLHAERTPTFRHGQVAVCSHSTVGNRRAGWRLVPEWRGRDAGHAARTRVGARRARRRDLPHGPCSAIRSRRERRSCVPREAWSQT